MAKDYYKTLGVNKNADDQELKKAFRKLAKQYHPDANPDDHAAEARFKEINEAYEVLSDSEKRSAYDRFGPDFNRMTGSPSGGYGQSVDMGDINIEDFIKNMFGGLNGFGGRGTQTRVNQKGADVEQPVTISLREAYEGTSRIITKGDRRIKADIPAGVTEGMKVRLAGEGGSGAQNGDLFLVVQIDGDPVFERSGNDLYTDVKVDVFTAMLGGPVEVRTMMRPVRMNIPPGTQSGKKLRISGKGMPILKQKDQFGDLYARVLITVPINLTDEQRELVEQLRDSFS